MVLLVGVACSLLLVVVGVIGFGCCICICFFNDCFGLNWLLRAALDCG